MHWVESARQQGGSQVILETWIILDLAAVEGLIKKLKALTSCIFTESDKVYKCCHMKEHNILCLEYWKMKKKVE